MKIIALALTAALSIGTASAQQAAHLSGAATVHNEQVPVRLDLVTEDGKATGTLISGPDTNATSSTGELTGTHLVLHFDYFARKLEGELTPAGFTGTFGGAKGTPVPLELHPATNAPKQTASAAPITGEWEIAVKSPKGESAWPLHITAEKSGEIKAVILRIDGDTGGLYGGYDAAKGEYRASHFTAAGPALYSFKQQPDGTLLVTNLLRDNQQWTARRPAEARKENLAPPTKVTEQTTLTDTSKPLEFSAPNLAGTVVTNQDPRFKDKVVLVAIGGSWCPNCHDEAPFLVELYNRYHAQGLEVVNLSFEEEDELKDPERLRAFVAKYKIPYPVLLAGTPDQLNAKLPQGKNLNCWPTTFFIGRDGLVKEVHAGFSGPATGAANTELKAETNTLVTKLLNEKQLAQR